ncbi:ProQ/FINO family protein [Rhodoferax sp. U2-2l]|uniref:ProQ/FINO family protein n=1 Tax=Rhodoferax sp. U2-2l TaxID=2884000 RepID=UPI001D0A5D4D|nr:ProQ/FINO family protein [Rhodoferax sp. U2-2l]MCB8746554.1 ProQ/FINO family protein [Rhodoferax sp. U2-2l]
MTDTLPDSHAPTPVLAEEAVDAAAAPAQAAAPAPTVPAKGKGRFASAQPVLEKLFELYPHLFGQRFVPLKLGVFQDLLAAHPDVFAKDELKVALGVHTRSTRYLQSVAQGLPRHDLLGQVVEPVAPEHVLLSMVEVFQRRQARSDEDLLPKLRKQMLAAYQASGLTRQDYLSRLTTLDEKVAALLDEVIDEVEQQRARQAALLRAFDASGKTVEDFAAELGMDVRQIQTALKQRKA